MKKYILIAGVLGLGGGFLYFLWNQRRRLSGQTGENEGNDNYAKGEMKLRNVMHRAKVASSHG